VWTALLLTSVNCAEIVTGVPASTFELLDVTRYLAAAPATVATLPLVPVRWLPSVPMNV
jgi:hypothetical protein